LSERAWTPTDEDLLAFDRGLLPDASADAVARWLEAHPEGEQRIQQLSESSPDGAVEALRQPCRIDAELERLSGVATEIIQRVLTVPGLGAQGLPPGVPESIRDYRLLGPLGQGGMGQVYRALHTRLQREVALKLLPAHLAADPSYRGRFEREMAVVGQLDHPHLIRAYDAGVEGPHLFLVMELLDGSNLARLVVQRGPLPLADACEVVRQASLGLEHAHAHGLVHRDVKPANLFLTRAGVVKVIDLGLARVLDGPVRSQELSSVHTVVGTPDCMAPEQWASAAVDQRADLYALGCTLFVLLTGRPPVTPQQPDSWVAWMDAHRWQPPPDLRERLPDAPAELAKLVAGLLAKDPRQRPAGARDVAERLAPWTAGHSLSEMDCSQAGRTWIGATTPRPRVAPKRWFRTWRLAPAAAILLAVMAVPSIWYFTRPQETPPVKLPQGDSSEAAPSLLLTGVDHVELGNTAGMIDLNGPFTVEMWVKFDRGVQYLVGDETWIGVGPPSITRPHGWVLRIDDERMNITLAETIKKDWVSGVGPTIKCDDQWHHIAVSKDAKVLRIFLDGSTYLDAKTADIRFVNCPLNLFLGPSNRHSPRAVNCSYRAFRVSDRQLYAAPFTPPREFTKTDDTLVLLDFSAGRGRVVPDQSGRDHHGVISGGQWRPLSSRGP
jgi:hypothetical protein